MEVGGGGVPAKTSQTGSAGKSSQTSLTAKSGSGGLSQPVESKKDAGGAKVASIEQIKSTARAVRLLKEKVLEITCKINYSPPLSLSLT